jgi:hypothetical protein
MSRHRDMLQTSGTWGAHSARPRRGPCGPIATRHGFAHPARLNRPVRTPRPAVSASPGAPVGVLTETSRSTRAAARQCQWLRITSCENCSEIAHFFQPSVTHLLRNQPRGHCPFDPWARPECWFHDGRACAQYARAVTTRTRTIDKQSQLQNRQRCLASPNGLLGHRCERECSVSPPSPILLRCTRESIGP